MREEGVRQVLLVDVKERLEIFRRLLLQNGKIRIEPLEKQRADLRIRLHSPEPAYLGLLEDVIAAQDLIGAFACQNHLVALLPDQAGKNKKWRGRRSKDRLFRLPDDTRKYLPDVVVAATDLVTLGS